MTTKNTLLLLKVGGGLISVKQNPRTSKPAVMKHLVRELVSAKTHFAFDTIIATGAGSYGHFTAHEFGLREGARTMQQVYGLTKAHAEAAELNSQFVQTLVDALLPALSIAPSSIMTCHDGKLGKTNFASVENCLTVGAIPVLHGDTIFDTTRGVTILSGERVLEACMIHFAKSYEQIIVVYLTNEKGVIDTQGEVLSDLPPEAELHITKVAAHDVTGGMKEKVIHARRAAQFGAQAVYIASGSEKGVLTDILKGNSVKGTRVT